MPFFRTLGCLALAGFLWAGCASPTPPAAQFTEPITNVVVLPPPKPLAPATDVAVTPTPPRPPEPAPSLPATNGASGLAAASVPTNRYAGRLWIPLAEWAELSALGKPQKLPTSSSPVYTVATDRGLLTLQMDSRIARFGGAQCWLGFPPRVIKGQPCLHVLDARKTLDPLLQRPAALAKPGRIVVIDPGHGGRDGGVSHLKIPLEKNYALDWAQRVQTLLQQNGWHVVLTRTNDCDLPLTNRLALADQLAADLFVSLHFNSAFPYLNHQGIETYCSTPLGMPSHLVRSAEDDPARPVPNNRWDEENVLWAWRFQRALLAATQAGDGGVRRTRFMKVLRDQRRPAVLIEGGYLSNPAEMQRIAMPAYRQALAEAVARALE